MRVISLRESTAGGAWKGRFGGGSPSTVGVAIASQREEHLVVGGEGVERAAFALQVARSSKLRELNWAASRGSGLNTTACSTQAY